MEVKEVLEKPHLLLPLQHNLALIEEVNYIATLLDENYSIDLHYFEYKSITIFFIFIVVLLVSTDPAHSLSDAFRCQFGAEPISPNENALPNLDVMELDPTVTVEVLTTLRSHILVHLLKGLCGDAFCIHCKYLFIHYYNNRPN